MTFILPYVVIAVLILAIAVMLARQGRHPIDIETESEKEFNHGLLEKSCLDLAERIFDPSDYRWLRDDLCFPQLARVLARHRKEMALRWLRGLRSAFNELVREPHVAGENRANDGLPGWVMAFHTLRFHAMLSFAMIMVWAFGPYHSIVPSFDWLRGVSGAQYRKDRYGVVKLR
ncbi:MAG: hypothetical protein ACYDA9_12120 [Terriglobia bacterium]